MSDELDIPFNRDETIVNDKQDGFIAQNEDIHVLTEQDKLDLLKMWDDNSQNPPSIEELCEKIRHGQKLDGRSKLGRSIKKYISSLNLPPPTTKTEYKGKGLLPLTDEQKEYIANNPNMKASEIACVLFEKNFLPALSQEVRTVLAFQKELENQGIYQKEIEDDADIKEYRPPKTLEHACARINKNIDGANYDSKKLTPTQKRQCMMLISYLHSFRFSHHFNLINESNDRKLFENTFVKYIYNKNDLSQEDLDQYLALANEAVAESSIKRTILMLEKEQEKSVQETGRIQMNLVDAIKTSRDEYNACRKRQNDLYKALEIERSKRLNERVGPQFTLLNIIEAMKNEERRKAIILEAEKRNEKLKEEVNRLSGLDSIICEIYGTESDLIING